MKVVKTATVSSKSNYIVKKTVSKRVKRKSKRTINWGLRSRYFKLCRKMPTPLAADNTKQKHRETTGPQTDQTSSSWWYESCGSSLFWKNYHRAQQWNQLHMTSYWKARCEALQFENEALHKFVQSQCLQMDQANYQPPPMGFADCTYPGAYPSRPQEVNIGQVASDNKEWKEVNHRDDNEDDDDDEELELAPEMLEFIKKSQKHKEERKQQKIEEEKMSRIEIGSEVLPEEPLVEKKAREKVELYGKTAPMIQAMEAAVQVTFEHNCDRYRPITWPSVALVA